MHWVLQQKNNVFRHLCPLYSKEVMTLQKSYAALGLGQVEIGKSTIAKKNHRVNANWWSNGGTITLWLIQKKLSKIV